MITIIKREECCGCSACQQICPRHCITMEPDNEGFLYPQTDIKKCIGCHLCETVCPVRHSERERIPIEVYAAYNKDEHIRSISSSGGLFTVVAEEVIKRGGIVFGVRFDEEWNAVFDYTKEVDDLQLFRGSKYVQAYMGDAYKNVRFFLEQGILVLFTGTPCQISGLKSFLRKGYKHLILLDLICEGVPSPKVWQKYLHEEKDKQSKIYFSSSKETYIKYLSFRNKEFGWKQFGFVLQLASKSHEKIVNANINRSSTYLQALFNYLDLRPICYECPFKGCRSQSDITIADYWGINYLHPEMDDDKGTSMVYINTLNGRDFFPFSDVHLLKTNYEEAFHYNNIVTSVKKHPNRDKFYNNIDKKKSIIKWLGNCTFPLSYKIKELAKKHLRKLFSSKTYKKLESLWRKKRK